MDDYPKCDRLDGFWCWDRHMRGWCDCGVFDTHGRKKEQAVKPSSRSVKL